MADETARALLAPLGHGSYAPPEALDAQGPRFKGLPGASGVSVLPGASGVGRITGTVKYSPAQPVHRKVRLLDDASGALIRETWSDATTGAYTFAQIDPTRTYTVLAYDYTGAFRAVVADRIKPELLP
jgi:hypothetical protein